MDAVELALKDFKKMQKYLLSFIEEEDGNGKFDKLIKIFNQQDIQHNKHKLKEFLYILSAISNNYHRTSNLYSKIFIILDFLKTDINNAFTNFEIFNIFKENNRVLLYLITNKLIVIDKSIFEIISKNQNCIFYFYPEVYEFIDKKNTKYELPDNYEEKRLIGENDSYICQLIRNDDIIEFVKYVNKNNISLSDIINPSIFETNQFLIKNSTISIIEYAVFFGSFHIYNYLRHNGVEMEDSLWLYAIHGKNPEIIHILEENHIEPEFNMYEPLINESIKCHHNEIADYLLQNHISDLYRNTNTFYREDTIMYYNYYYMEKFIFNPSRFCEFIIYDYFYIVDLILKREEVATNEQFTFKISVYCFFEIFNQLFQ